MMRGWLLHALLLVAFAATTRQASAQTQVGPFSFTPTRAFGALLGRVVVNGYPAAAEDVVAAVDSAGQVVGAAAVVLNDGQAYVNLLIYGADGSTSGAVLRPGGSFRLRLYHAATGRTAEGDTYRGWQPTIGQAMPGYADYQQPYAFRIEMPPQAVADTASTPEDMPVLIAVLANDTDPNGDPLAVALAERPAHGAAVVLPDGSVRYTPEADYNGADAFTYVAHDADGGESMARVSVSVRPVNDPPPPPAPGLPAGGADVRVPDDAAARLSVSWPGTADPEGAAVRYTLQVAATGQFDPVLLSMDAGTETRVEVPFADLLDCAGTGAERTAALYYRVVASDGEVATPGPAAMLRLTMPLPLGAETDVAAAFALRGNYPNPFNPATQIRLDLPAAADVSVAVYDVAGRLVLMLPAQPLPAGAGRTLLLDAAGLASGTYMYRVTARTGSEVRLATGKMVVLR